MPRFAANLGYLFTDRPLIERIDAAAACGFKAIELQFPYDAAGQRCARGDRAQSPDHSRHQHAAGPHRRV
jgi:hydroxypyruvate isomerase